VQKLLGLLLPRLGGDPAESAGYLDRNFSHFLVLSEKFSDCEPGL
jgi:hypothetical protein